MRDLEERWREKESIVSVLGFLLVLFMVLASGYVLGTVLARLMVLVE